MVEAKTWFVTSFYRFVPVEPVSVGKKIEGWMLDQGLLGLVVVAPEGVNGTVAGDQGTIEAFKEFVQAAAGVNDFRFKDSSSEKPPFRRVTVDIRNEIVGLKRPDLVPETEDNRHLTPSEWHRMLESDQPKLLIDTRNRYETQVGMFKGAIDPDLGTFSDWSRYLEQEQLPKDVPVMIYCTGGIRCEKAILEMRTHGIENVYQLRDGILGYLAEYPDGLYEGECYVFDDRVTVGPDLKPTGNYGTCPGCGLTADIPAVCEWCEKNYFLCAECQPKRAPVCSKSCLDKFGRHGTRSGTKP